MATDDFLPGVELLPNDLHAQLLPHEARMLGALARWRLSGSRTDYAEVTSRIACIRFLAINYDNIDERAASAEARRKIVIFCGELETGDLRSILSGAAPLRLPR